MSSPIYWSLAGVLGLCVAAAHGLARRDPRRWTPAFLTSCALLLLALRGPIVFDRRLHIDEAQMTAQAITAASHPIPWKSFDPTTSGPLNTYVLLLPHLFGVPIGAVATKIVALLLV